MNAEAPVSPGTELARILDAHGSEVTVVTTRPGLLVILTQTPVGRLKGGHPCLNRENAVELRDALNEFLRQAS